MPPKMYDCGGDGQPACPPEPAAISEGDPSVATYTYNDMAAHGAAQYAKGRADLAAEQERIDRESRN